MIPTILFFFNNSREFKVNTFPSDASNINKMSLAESPKDAINLNFILKFIDKLATYSCILFGSKPQIKFVIIKYFSISLIKTDFEISLQEFLANIHYKVKI